MLKRLTITIVVSVILTFVFTMFSGEKAKATVEVVKDRHGQIISVYMDMAQKGEYPEPVNGKKSITISGKSVCSVKVEAEDGKTYRFISIPKFHGDGRITWELKPLSITTTNLRDTLP